MSADRRQTWVLIFAAAVLTLVRCGGQSEPAYQQQPLIEQQLSSGRQPNVLLISLDTLRADHLGCYGYSRDTSPFLDDLAAEGVRFENAFVNTHSTGPSHMTLLSSRYQETHRVLYDHYRRGEASRAGKLDEWLAANSVVPADIEMLQETLSRAGYWTVGVTGGGFVGASTGMNRGFDQYDDSSRDVREGAKKLLETIKGRPPEDDRPIFAFFHTFQIHGPYVSPPEYDNLFDQKAPPEFGPGEDARAFIQRVMTDFLGRASEVSPEVLEFMRLKYDRSILYTDDVLREMFSSLESAGFFQDYVVVVTSDHGEEFGEHGNLQHTDLLFEGLVRIPLILKGSRVAKGVVVDDRLASTIDILPTIAALCGVKAPAGIEGANLLAPSPVPRKEQFVFMQRGAIAYALRTPRWKLIEGPPPHPYDRSAPLPVALYDLENDPGEQRNVAKAHPERTAKLLEKLHSIKSRLRATAAGDAEGELSQKEMERLKSLGYVQ